VLEHEIHLIATSVDSRDTKPEGGDQVVERLVQPIRQDGAFQVAPQPLDQVQARTVGGQPVNPDLPAVLLEPLPYSVSVMKPTVVTNQANLATRVCPQQRYQEYQEIRSRLGWSDRVGDPSSSVVDSTIHHGFLVLPGGRDLRLRADRSPDPAEGWVPMDFNLVLIDQDFRSVGAGRFFFKRSSSSAAC
jgi:hypothetical protein